MPPELAELQVKAQAAEIEAMARWTYESRLADMGETIVVFDAKRRASRWSNDQPSKYRKVAYLFGFLVNYSTHQKDASWEWLAKQYKHIHKDTISPRTLRRLAKEMAALGLLEITENTAEDHGACNCFRCEHPGAQLWNTYTIHCGLAARNDRSLVVHDWNAALEDTTPKVGSAECKRCGAGFDPKRKDARYCSARCRKAASREDVTDNDQGVDHPVDHGVGHPSQLVNSSDISSSSSRAGDDERDLPHPSGEKLTSSPSAQSEVVPGSGTTQPKTTKSGSSRPSEDRVPAEKVISRINEVVHDFQLTPRLGWRPVSKLLGQYSADDLVDAVRWRKSDEYAGEVYVSPDSRNRAAVLISRLGDLAEEWIEFRTEHGVKSWAEYVAIRPPSEDVAEADECHPELDRETVLQAPREAAAAEAQRLEEERAAAAAYEQVRRDAEAEERARQAAEQHAERARLAAARERELQDKAARGLQEYYVDSDGNYRAREGRGRPRAGEVAVDLTAEEVEELGL